MHLKIVLDVIKDTASTRKMQTGSYGAFGEKESFSLAAPLERAIWTSHDLQTRWHREDEEGAHL